MKRRLFSLFLALMMCISLLPMSAFAEGTVPSDTNGEASITNTPTVGDTPTVGGAICSHSEVYDTGDNIGKCKNCDHQYKIQVIITPAGGTPTYTYYDDLKDARQYIVEPEKNGGVISSDGTTAVTIKLLDDATSSGSISLFVPCQMTIDLNGKTLTASSRSISVFDVENYNYDNATLKMTVDGTLDCSLMIYAGTADISNGNFTSLSVNNGAKAQLSGGTFDKVSNGVGDVHELLAPGFDYRSTTADGSWVCWNEPTDNKVGELEGVTVVAAPIKASIAAEPDSIAYGSETTLTTTVEKADDVTGDVSYQWYLKGWNSPQKLDGETNAVYTATGSFLGKNTFYCLVTLDGYSTLVSADVTVSLKPTAKTGLIFETTTQNSVGVAVEQQLITASEAGTLPPSWKMFYSFDKETWTENAADIRKKDAGTYTVYWYAKNGPLENIGSENDPNELQVTIAPKKVAKTFVSGTGVFQLYIKHKIGEIYTDSPSTDTYIYTGSPITPEIRLEDHNKYVIPESGYSYTITDNIEASNFEAGFGKITVIDNDPNDNFEIIESVFLFDIARKTVTLTPDSYTHYHEIGESTSSVECDLQELAQAMGMPTNDGSLEIKLANYPSASNGMYVDSDGHTLKIDNPSIGSYSAVVLVGSKNHRSQFSLEVNVSRKAKIGININNVTKDYDGAAVTVNDVIEQVCLQAPDGATIDSNAGSWSWFKTGTAPTNVADSGEYWVIFTPNDSESFAPATIKAPVTINAKNIDDTATITATAAGGVYSGEVITPTLTVTYTPAGGSALTLVQGTDYTIDEDESTLSATDKGTYYVTINGTGNYTGTRQVAWTITSKAYTGSGHSSSRRPAVAPAPAQEAAGNENILGNGTALPTMDAGASSGSESTSGNGNDVPLPEHDLDENSNGESAANNNNVEVTSNRGNMGAALYGALALIVVSGIIIIFFIRRKKQ